MRPFSSSSTGSIFTPQATRIDEVLMNGKLKVELPHRLKGMVGLR